MLLYRINNFNLKQIADSGQCFRMTALTDTVFQLIFKDHYLIAEQMDEDTIAFYCSEDEFHHIWSDYFDLQYDYASLIDALCSGQDTFLAEAAAYGKGIRILKQDPFEATISFIMSQNKNIPAIMKSIESLCILFGEKKYVSSTFDAIELPVFYYAFPTPKALADADPLLLKSTKAGYRADYIKKASQAVILSQINLEALRSLPSHEAVLTLKSLYGVGEKVANCIALFGLHKIDVFPVDVWIQRIIDEHYGSHFPLELYHSHAGIVQQYMFYYKRACS